MIGITPDNDLGLGDVTVEYRFDVKLIKSLLNLENNRIVPDKEAIMKKELIGEFLSDFIYLPDVLLHHDRLVLPRPKKFYIKKIGEELLSSCIIEKLEKSGILHFPQSEIYDIEMAKETHKQLIDLASSDPRVRLIALLSAPDAKLNSTWLKKHNFVEKNKDFNRYWAGGSDDIVEWLNTVDLEKMYAVIPKDVARDPILSRRKVEGSPGYSVFLTSNISVIDGGYYSQDFKFFDDIARKELKQGSKLLAKHLQNKLSKPSESSLWRILNRLSETRASIEKDLIERKYITATQTYRIPFSLGLLISEADKELNPVDLIDLILEKRRERGNRAFRRWLKEYDDEIKKNSPDRYKLKRMGDEIDQVALKLREEYPGKILTEKTIHSA